MPILPPSRSTLKRSAPTDLPVREFRGRDGVELAFRELGEGRPLLLFHGFLSNATVNWLRYGHAALLAARGFRVILPDLRGHGDSVKSHHAAAYPPDVLADDGLALIEELGLDDYDLGGYSLGGRTTMRLLVRGAKPRRAVVAGMGLEGIIHSGGHSAFFRRVLSAPGSFRRGSPEWLAEAFFKTVGGDPEALLLLLDSFVPTPREALARVEIPVLVAAGATDDVNTSARALAAELPKGRFVELPGNHMSAVAGPELGAAIVDFLGG